MSFYMMAEMNSAIRILIRHLQCPPTLTEGVSKLFTLFFTFQNNFPSLLQNDW